MFVISEVPLYNVCCRCLLREGFIVFQDQRAVSAPATSSAVNQFKVGMKLEAKDRQHPSLVCVASITEIKNGQLLIHFDGWTSTYDYWCEPTSADVHPTGWCQAQSHELQPPKGTEVSKHEL